MKLFTVAAALGFATPAFLQKTYTARHETLYDKGKTSLSHVACSNGGNGLLTEGYTTFDTLPTYPFVGGTSEIQSWNSPNCGTCWELTYVNPEGTRTSFAFTAINEAPQGSFTLSIDAMNRLTAGDAHSLDGGSITVTQLPAAGCWENFDGN